MSKRPRDRQNFVRGVDLWATKGQIIMNKSENDDVKCISSGDDPQSLPWENESEFTSNSNVLELAIRSLLVEWKQRGLNREMHQEPDKDRYTFDEEGTVVDDAADELDLIDCRSVRLG